MQDGNADTRDASGDHSQVNRPGVGVLGLLVAGLVLAPAWTAGASGASIASQREQVRQLEAQVFEITGRAEQARSGYVVARDRLVAVRQRIGRNRTELKRARDNQRIAQTRLADRLSAMYRTPDPSVVDAFVTTGSVTEALTSWSVFQRVADQDFTTVRGIRQTKVRIKAIQAELLVDRRKARSHFSDQSARFRELSKLQSERRQLLSGARAQLAAFIQAEAIRQAAFARARAEAAAQAAARARPAAPGSATPTPPAQPSSASTTAALEAIAHCESGGSATAVSATGQFRGKYQFDPGTWKKLGGSGDPAKAPEAQQDRLAAKLLATAGTTPWPVCGRFAR